MRLENQVLVERIDGLEGRTQCFEERSEKVFDSTKQQQPNRAIQKGSFSNVCDSFNQTARISYILVHVLPFEVTSSNYIARDEEFRACIHNVGF